MSIIIKHVGGIPNDGVNCNPDGPKTPTDASPWIYDHRVCPASIAVDSETGMMVDRPGDWPARKSRA